MRFYNTLSAKKEEFTTPDGTVRMYVCGITPYSASHLGHAMFSIVFDVVRRYLEYKGLKVKHVQNFTDVDDKMIQASLRTGVPVETIAEQNIEAYLQETDALNVKRAHIYPRATQEIGKIVEMIQGLVDKGYAYSVDGDVYFRVRKGEDYGKLSRRSLDSMLSGARVEIDEDKEDALDFALWKSQKPGEPAWDSPWGPGRPGWHIECSAMSVKYLDQPLDIHGGGQDLIFPHHENEIAQTESWSGKSPFARFWLHNGFLQLGEDKMSKSLGNIITVREALDKFSSDAIRLFFLNSHYRSPLAYSEDNIASQERAAERLRSAAAPTEKSGCASEIGSESFRHRFVEAMDDDLNTPRALAVLFDLARAVNREREDGQDASQLQETLRELAEVLGLTLEAKESETQADVAPFVELLIETRNELRAAKQYALADKLRDRIGALGVILEDKPNGTEWKLKSP